MKSIRYPFITLRQKRKFPGPPSRPDTHRPTPPCPLSAASSRNDFPTRPPQMEPNQSIPRKLGPRIKLPPRAPGSTPRRPPIPNRSLRRMTPRECQSPGKSLDACVRAVGRRRDEKNASFRAGGEGGNLKREARRQNRRGVGKGQWILHSLAKTPLKTLDNRRRTFFRDLFAILISAKTYAED